MKWKQFRGKVRKAVFSSSDRRTMTSMLAAGARNGDIAAAFGVSESRIVIEVATHGLRPDGLSSKPPRRDADGDMVWPQEAVDFVLKRHRDGASGAEIAAETTARFGRPRTRNSIISLIRRRLPSSEKRPDVISSAVTRRARISAVEKDAAARRDGRSHGYGAISIKANRTDRIGVKPPQKVTRLSVRHAAAMADAPRLAAVGDELLPAGQQPVGCRFIEGDVSASRCDDPTEGGWRYCQRAPAAGAVYCPAHAAACLTASDAVRRFALEMNGTPDAIAAAVADRFGIEISPYTVRAWRGWRRRAAANQTRAAV